MWSSVFLHCHCTKDELFLKAFCVAMECFHSMVIVFVHHSFIKRFVFWDLYRPTWGTEWSHFLPFRKTLSRSIPAFIFSIISAAKRLTTAQLRWDSLALRSRKECIRTFCFKFPFSERYQRLDAYLNILSFHVVMVLWPYRNSKLSSIHTVCTLWIASDIYWSMPETRK